MQTNTYGNKLNIISLNLGFDINTNIPTLEKKYYLNDNVLYSYDEAQKIVQETQNPFTGIKGYAGTSASAGGAGASAGAGAGAGAGASVGAGPTSDFIKSGAASGEVSGLNTKQYSEHLFKTKYKPISLFIIENKSIYFN